MTFTKELAKLFRKITNSEIDAEGNAHVVLSPADSLLINNARIALAALTASMEREPVYLRPFGDDGETFVACDSDDERAIALYAAPRLPQTAVVSVPDEAYSDDCPDLYPSQPDAWAEGWNACRAAMLQGKADGNSPVITDGWVACSDRIPETRYWVIAHDEVGTVKAYICEHSGEWIRDNGDELYAVTHWMPLPAAPQQEVK